MLIFVEMISKEQLPKGTRVIEEGVEIGPDVVSDRITVVIDDDDKIKKVYRG